MVKNKLALFIVCLVMMSITVHSALSATVSHDASQILYGTFGSGNFIFPNNLSIFGHLYLNNTMGMGNITICAEGEVYKVTGGVWACGTDSGGNASLGTDVVDDEEMNYTDVTLVDFTNDAGYITSYTDTNETVRVDQLELNNISIDGRLDTLESNDPNDWDAIGDVPTSSPANGDTANLSTADMIYDWVTGLGYATTIYVDASNTSQNTLLALLRTDNTTQATELDLLRTDNATQGAKIDAITIPLTYPATNITLGTFTGTEYNFTSNVNITKALYINVSYFGPFCQYYNGTHLVIENPCTI